MEAKRGSPLLLLLPLVSMTIIFFIHGCSAMGEEKMLVGHGRRKPCKTIVFYLHDLLYDETNIKNFTSVIVATPSWDVKNKLSLKFFGFGEMVVFNDPLTVGRSLGSRELGRAEGFYFYDNKKIFSLWFGMTLTLNTTKYNGTISLAGANHLMEKTRDMPVIGGTGDFFMTRGIATIITDEVQNSNYFRIRVDVKLYECY
ncbi:hypothetical protein QJS10_CPB17g01707 [Acorus calamus]|uniref:Dirigent protein n=1 Tax=Acorus calamus TaxID=4465 RepID=A0AAV9CUA8_ACOCL|nr:hypothetical protein QJS10_CPB17g01707 [Acorus calamus]